ncbi:hypothetical protein ASF08_18010 [Methylobacterium sp. Leaf85]|nr:hypothetical protein ASF08_18010 [Methylobacterium sp. Leaf85]
MHPPRLDRIPEAERLPLTNLLANNAEVQTELAALGCPAEATADQRLLAIAESNDILISIALVGPISGEAARMIEEHRSFRRLLDMLREEVQDVAICDPYQALPDLSAHNLLLLDYYLNGPSRGGDLAVTVATNIRNQANRAPNQQIVLMSSLESVRDLRGQFRTETDLTGSAFAFIGKPDLNEAWKVKAHLGMLERARPYAPAFIDYRAKLEESLEQARTDLLTLVDDLDIGDYAFLQGRALMKDGHPLGDYVFWLLSSQLMALAFERDEMRERQRALDTLEFVGAPFAATEPSTVVANLLHSALVSRNIGPLGPHPRAKPGTPYAHFPLVQLGDVFLNGDRSKAVVVMSADCDLAFSPMPERAPDADTPVMLVPGTPVKLKDAKDGDDEADANTDGILHREEVYRIVWQFAKYRSVALGTLRSWLVAEGYDVTNRDRLRPLFGLKLQQEFGAHLMRVGPPIMPPMTTKAVGQVFICAPDPEEGAKFDASELMLTRFKKQTWLRVTPRVAGILKQQCEELRIKVEEQLDQAPVKKKQDFQRKMDSITTALDDDDFWIKLLDGVELNTPGSVKAVGPIGFVVGSGWTDNKPRVMVEIREDAATPKPGPQGGHAGEIQVELEITEGSISSAA